MRRHEQLSLLLGDLIATHPTNYNGDGKPGFGITRYGVLVGNGGFKGSPDESGTIRKKARYR
ncbi:MAG: hypothetical protein HC789_09325 [Microcoleus sp. CSU_2_2]|nr:hypothetical protein [Microcoleus sp. CSU_2_2]